MAKNRLPDAALDFFRKQGAKGGKKGSESLTPEERVARAKKAVAAREAKRKSAGAKP